MRTIQASQAGKQGLFQLTGGVCASIRQERIFRKIWMAGQIGMLSKSVLPGQYFRQNLFTLTLKRLIPCA